MLKSLRIFYLFIIYLLPHPFIKDIDYDFLVFFSLLLLTYKKKTNQKQKTEKKNGIIKEAHSKMQLALNKLG